MAKDSNNRYLFPCSRFLRFVGWVSAFCVAIVFAKSGFSKIERPHLFVDAILKYRMLGGWLAIAVAAVIPWVELTVAMCIAAGVLRRGALVCALALITVFAIAQATILARGMKIGCGCFGDPAEFVTWTTVVRSLVLWLTCVIGLYLLHRPTVSYSEQGTVVSKEVETNKC